MVPVASRSGRLWLLFVLFWFWRRSPCQALAPIPMKRSPSHTPCRRGPSLYWRPHAASATRMCFTHCRGGAADAVRPGCLCRSHGEYALGCITYVHALGCITYVHALGRNTQYVRACIVLQYVHACVSRSARHTPCFLRVTHLATSRDACSLSCVPCMMCVTAVLTVPGCRRAATLCPCRDAVRAVHGGASL